MPRVRGGEPITMFGYPIAMVLAEKIVTAIERGVANTRWRDFADIWTLRRAHRINGDELQRALATVAEHRKVTLSTMSSLVADYPQIAQHKWQTWSGKQGRPELPDSFADVLAAVAELADPALHLAADGKTWDPARLSWT